MREHILLSIISITFLWSCQKVNQIDLVGKWKAIEVLEQGSPLAVDVQKINMYFFPNHYEYTSTLKYQEAGHYRIQSNLLFTKDTTKSDALEKAVEIAKIDKDSLFLRMNENGKERILKMVREGNK